MGFIITKIIFVQKVLNSKCTRHACRVSFPSIRMDLDQKKRKWKVIINRYPPKGQIETEFTVKF